MATTSAFGWETPDDTDLVKDGAAAIRTLGNSIDTSMSELKGGTTGQVLSKTSNTDMDFTWTSALPLTTKGDLYTYSTTNTRLAVGANDLVLTAASGESTGLKYSGGWQSWTPTFTGITIGNGTVTARYAQVGKVVTFMFRVVFGSTTSISGVPTFTLPKSNPYDFFLLNGNILDAGVANYNGAAQAVANDGFMYWKLYTVGSGYLVAGNVTATTPITWGTGDTYLINGTYEVA